ncbi:MAG TPA: hypothetical protein DDZ80_23010 [Cyanobacteria bacterium UBA8803]|nr:hypothetical protein [Cyanobacteria bacterium UBA9273]HBL61197.1 hypothetical protein [Cyanobacteria bacterium UBA8803]
MKILLITDHFYPDLSSGGRLLTDLALGLVEAGNQVQVITASPDVNTAKIQLPNGEFFGVKIDNIRLKNLSKYNLKVRVIYEILFCLTVFFRVLFYSSADVIFTLSSPPFLPYFVAFLSRLKRIPYVYVVMDVYPDIAINLGLLKPNSKIVKLWDWISILALRNATRVVVLGRCMYNVIHKKMAGSAVPIDIIHNWSNAEKIQPLPRAINPFFINNPHLKEKFIVQYSGNLGRFQDFETILGSAEKLKTNSYIHFLIIGEGFQREWLLNEVERRSLNNVTLLSFQPQEELVYSLNAANVALVTLKRGAEGLGVPSKFYPILAAGKPVLAIMAEWAEVALTVKEFAIGIVLEQDNIDSLAGAINKWSSDPEELDKIGKRSRDLFLQRFDRSYAIEAYQKCLHLAVSLEE